MMGGLSDDAAKKLIICKAWLMISHALLFFYFRRQFLRYGRIHFMLQPVFSLAPFQPLHPHD